MKHFCIKQLSFSIFFNVGKFKTILIFLALIINLSITNAQKMTMLFSKSMLSKTPRMIVFELSDSSGNINPSSDIFNQAEMIYFLAKPQQEQDWVLSRKDAEKKLTEIKLIQGLNEISPYHSKALFSNDDIKAVVLSFPKYKINILKEIKIKLEEAETESAMIPEKLWPGFKIYSDIISNASSYSLNGDYINSFKTLSKLWCKDTLTSKFSFYTSAKDSLNFFAEQIILRSNNKFTKQFELFKLNSSEQNLNQLFILKDSIFENLQLVDTFLLSIKTEIDAVSKSISIDKQKQDIAKNLEQSKILFRKKKLAIFETKTYQDYQLKLFTEALSKLITSVDKIKQISSFDTIYYDKLKNFPSINKELVEMGWSGEFQTICNLLNENIRRFNYIFNDTVINNFSQNKLNESQPYYALFRAFNALVKKDKRLFIDLVNQCMYAISDKELLSSLDLYVALVNNESTINEEFWELLQKGYNSQVNGSFQEAKLSYDKAEKLSNTSEILYFLMAETNIKLSDRYSASIYFTRANTINPKFILPKLYQIDFLIEDKDYETALTLANEALVNIPIWYFYFKKAILLGMTGKFIESKQLLINNCLPLNPLNYEQYIFLGDVFNGLTDIKSAREYYMKAGNIKPNDSLYKNKMESLKQSQEIKPVK
ncbi:MAG: tetratricopeptide repeat protein [Bacteroidales bacterium]